MGEKGVLPTLQAELADLLYSQGRLDEAEAVAREAEALSASDDSLTEMKWRSVLAKVHARKGRISEAIALATQASEIASTTGFLDWQAGVLVDVAEVWLLAGKPEEARRCLGRAAALYERKGNDVARRAVEGRLAELAAV
jgi:ATP/maltotriose-dependent transcriptional regulator MalT